MIHLIGRIFKPHTRAFWFVTRWKSFGVWVAAVLAAAYISVDAYMNHPINWLFVAFLLALAALIWGETMKHRQRCVDLMLDQLISNLAQWPVVSRHEARSAAEFSRMYPWAQPLGVHHAQRFDVDGWPLVSSAHPVTDNVNLIYTVNGKAVRVVFYMAGRYGLWAYKGGRESVMAYPVAGSYQDRWSRELLKAFFK